MLTLRKSTLEMLQVLRQHILDTGMGKYNQLEGKETIEKIIDANMGIGFLWGEMQKRLDEIAVNAKYGMPFDRDLLKLLHEGLMLLALRHEELVKNETTHCSD